jgi:hypothetical protein
LVKNKLARYPIKVIKPKTIKMPIPGIGTGIKLSKKTKMA